MKTRLLSICCSFRRPDMLKDMIASFMSTRSEGTELFTYLHVDDPYIEKYMEYIGDYNFKVDRHRCLQEVINHVVFDVYPEVPYYQIICDDHVYRTDKWDSILISAFEKKSNGWGFACGNDGANNWNWNICRHPSAEIWSWKQASLLGYVYPKNMEAMHLDYFTKALADAVDGLVFVPDVKIEHLWYGGCSKPPDDNIKDKYNDVVLRKAQAQFDFWKNNNMKSDVEKILSKRKEEGWNGR